MPRKYEVPVVAGCGHPVHACTCAPKHAAMTGKVVTAIDARDVEPLRDALQQISKAKPTTGVPLKDTLAGCRQLATGALKAFEDEEGSG